jgi:nucleoside-triphosphatase THEP1
MITIVTGEIDSGKTRYLKKLYEKDHKGDGVLSLKHYNNDRCIGYNLYHLRSEEQKGFIRLKTDLPKDWIEQHNIGRFSFSEEGFNFGEKILKNIKAGPVYIDEIGPLEIWEKKGFYNILKELVKKHSDLFLTLRPSLIDDLHDEFELSGKTKIITLK